VVSLDNAAAHAAGQCAAAGQACSADHVLALVPFGIFFSLVRSWLGSLTYDWRGEMPQVVFRTANTEYPMSDLIFRKKMPARLVLVP
jgi:hypothetical protein